MGEQRPDAAGKALTGVILSLQANVQNLAGRGRSSSFPSRNIARSKTGP